MAAAALSAHATEWEFSWANPLPQGNALGGVAFEDASTGYAVGDRGAVIKSTDGGLIWEHISLFPALSADLKDVLVLSPGSLLAVGSSPGIFRSDDGGQTWAPVPNPSTATLQDIEVLQGATLSVVGASGQVLRSTDSGSTWTLLGTAPMDLQEQHWISPSRGYVLGIGSVRQTTDSGQTWTAVPGVTDSGSAFNEMWFTDAQHGYMFDDFHLYKTTNGGASWTGDFIFGQFLYCANVIVLGPLHFIAVSNLEGAVVAETTDGGSNWDLRLLSGADGFLDLERLPDGAMITASNGGDVFRSTDDGQTWTLRTGDQPPRNYVGAIGLSPAGLGAAGTSGTPGLRWYQTTDHGATWQPNQAGPEIAFTSDIRYWDGANGIAAGDYLRMWRTTDGGAQWTDIALPNPPQNGAAWDLSLPEAGIGFAAVSGQTQSTVYRTTDSGSSWHQRGTGLPGGGYLVGISFVTGQTGYVTGFSTGAAFLYKTTNAGASWTVVPTAGFPSRPNDLLFLDAQVGFATAWQAESGIFRTTNGGSTWTRVSTQAANEIAFDDALLGCASEETFWTHGRVQVTEDGGLSWNSVDLPSTGGGSCVAAVEGGFVVGGTNGTIVRMLRAGGTSSAPQPGGAGPGRSPDRGWAEFEKGEASHLRVERPVAAEVEVSFILRETGHVDLAVFDVRGSRVASLVRGTIEGEKTVTAKWTGTMDRGGTAPSGVYFVRLSAGSEGRARKVVLAR